MQTELQKAREEQRRILDAIGRGELARRLDVRVQAISESLKRGRFPASWYRTVREMGDDKGLEVPLDLFAFKREDEDRQEGAAA